MKGKGGWGVEGKGGRAGCLLLQPPPRWSQDDNNNNLLKLHYRKTVSKSELPLPVWTVPTVEVDAADER